MKKVIAASLLGFAIQAQADDKWLIVPDISAGPE